MPVVDNNILSSLAKIKRLDLLKKFFGEVLTVPEVIREFEDEAVIGYDFPKEIHQRRTYREVNEDHWILVVSLSPKENENKERLIEEGSAPADAECLSVSLNRNEILITDDTQLGEIAESKVVKVYDLETFLEACARRKIISSLEEVKEILSDLEEKDYYTFSEEFKTQITSIFE